MRNDDWEMRVENSAKAFPYPQTPDIAAGLRARQRVGLRRLAQVAAVVLLAFAALLAVPEIRAQVIALFRIGAVEVVVTTATPPAHFGNSDLPESVLDFPGVTTLEDAEAHAGYAVMLPSALGAPDRVYLVQAYRPIVVLAWLDANGAVDYSLHLLPSGTYSIKMTGGNPVELQVNGARALWISEPHWYLLRTGTSDSSIKTRHVMDHALIWAGENDTMTYRLETRHSLDDALRVAQSIPAGNG